MLRWTLALGVGVACASAVILYLTRAATFGMDRRGHLDELPFGLWLLVVLTSLLVGFIGWRLLRRR